MTAFDDNIVATTLRLVAKFGAPYTVTEHSSFSYDASSGAGLRVGIAPATITMVPPFPYEHNLIDHDLIQSGDARTWVAASGLTITPRTGMKVTIDTEEWRVISVVKVRSGTSVVLYELQLRGG